MRTLKTILVVSMASAVICGLACVPASADATEDIMAVLGDFAKAVEAEDVAGMLAFYADDWSKDGSTPGLLRYRTEKAVSEGVYKNTVLVLSS